MQKQQLIVRPSDLPEVIGISRARGYALLDEDPTFPRLRELGSPGAVGWLFSELKEWVERCPQIHRGDLDPRRKRGAA